MTVGIFLLSLFSIFFCAWIGTKIGMNKPFYFISDSNKILAVLLALSAFLFFKNVKVGYSKFINTVAASTFGVLQIHANSDAMRKWLWRDVLNNVGMYDSEWLILHAFGSVLTVFTICVLLDLLRIHFIEEPLFKFCKLK